MSPPATTNNPPSKHLLPQSFIQKKRKILQSLSIPVEEYDDLSPKGSIDEGIRELIDEINGLEGCVTTSSCAGRVCVFVEGDKSAKVTGDGGAEGEEDGERTQAKIGGKGGGGKWLFVSHDPVPVDEEVEAGKDGEGKWIERLGMREANEGGLREGFVKGKRFVHFKFEAMILHVLTASLNHAQIVLSAALQAGFRESGALNLISNGEGGATPMVGIRSMGLGLESVVGIERDGEGVCTVREWELDTLVRIANERFVENTRRIERFRTLLKELMEVDASGGKKKEGDSGEWEDKDARRERKRAEGLRKAEAAKSATAEANTTAEETEELPDIGMLMKDS